MNRKSRHVCFTLIGTDSDDGCGCCNLPQPQLGFAQATNYVIQVGGQTFTGFGVATSTVSQADADEKARDAAIAHATLKKNCGTPPIGGLQLFIEW